jgi:hypothetical protein
MLNEIEQWINQTNDKYKGQRVCCGKFSEKFNGFYSQEFLQQAYYVVVNSIPKPDFPELRQMGLGDFIDMEVEGITYKNTYYVLPHVADNLRLHFHELVHVAQWSQLGAISFMQRYINEIQSYGYDEAPLEKMAYAFDTHFSQNGKKVDVVNYVSQKI